MLVLDASAALPACTSALGFDLFAGEDLVAPAVMWSEARATLHLQSSQGRLERSTAATAHDRLERAPVRRVDRAALGRTAWRIADELGWARTYDAEYVALAQLLGCRLVTLDLRLRRGADRLGIVVTPAEL
jgi:predicted nucleic acid-binding protein